MGNDIQGFRIWIRLFTGTPEQAMKDLSRMGASPSQRATLAFEKWPTPSERAKALLCLRSVSAIRSACRAAGWIQDGQLRVEGADPADVEALTTRLGIS